MMAVAALLADQASGSPSNYKNVNKKPVHDGASAAVEFYFVRKNKKSRKRKLGCT